MTSRPTLVAVLAGLAWLLLAAGAAGAQPQAHYRTGADGVILPDSSATPGATRTVADLCPIAHTKLVRHVTSAQKRRAYAVYGATPKPGVSTFPRRARTEASTPPDAGAVPPPFGPNARLTV